MGKAAELANYQPLSFKNEKEEEYICKNFLGIESLHQTLRAPYAEPEATLTNR